MAPALDAAHAAGLVHRDVKPANILVDARPGRPDHVYLSDFGVSKGATASVSLTGTGQFLGTPDYSAPEQIQGRAVDGRADQYALACVAYQMLTGQAPFERDQGLAVLLAHLSKPPPSLRSRRPDLPEAADRVLARAMAKAPEQRYGSCGDFADALREALGLAPYHPRGPAAAPDHPQTQVVSQPEFPGSATAGAGTAAVPADLASTATASATATMVPPVTETAPSPVSSAAGRTDAEPDVGPTAFPGDGEQRATPPPRDDHPRVAAGGPGPGPGEKTPTASRPRRTIWRRPVIIAATAVGIAVIGLVIAITTISGTPSTSARWTYTTGGVVSSVPAVAGGTVYVGSHDFKVYALDTATGRLRWTHTTAGEVVSSPAVADGTVYVGSDDGKVYALDAATGQVQWTHTTGGNVASSPPVAGGTVYVGSWDGKVYALDAGS